MASFNQVILLGNLTRDPQMRYIPSTNTPVVDFGMAMNRKYKSPNGEEREEVVFVDCSAFGRLAEIINQYCHKGKPLFVQGRLKLDQWEDKQGGGKRSRLTVVVENFQLLGGRDSAQGQGSGGGEYDQTQAPARRSAPPRGAPPQGGGQAPPEQPYPDEEQFKPDDIPF